MHSRDGLRRLEKDVGCLAQFLPYSFETVSLIEHSVWQWVIRCILALGGECDLDNTLWVLKATVQIVWNLKGLVWVFVLLWIFFGGGWFLVLLRHDLARLASLRLSGRKLWRLES